MHGPMYIKRISNYPQNVPRTLLTTFRSGCS